MTYTFLQKIELLVFVIRTKILFPNARIIRFPIDIRGKRFISIKSGFTTGRGCRLEAYPTDKKSIVLIFGKNIQMNDYVHITAMKRVFIGNNVLIASKVYISDCSHGSYCGDEFDSSPLSIPRDREYKVTQVTIEDNVWIGEFVSILPGVTIGTGSIIGANSVVNKSIPPYCMAVGSPAKIIKNFNFETNRWERIK